MLEIQRDGEVPMKMAVFTASHSLTNAEFSRTLMPFDHVSNARHTELLPIGNRVLGGVL